MPRIASRREATRWWCFAYHARFGRCCPRCQFERVVGGKGWLDATKTVQKCAITAAAGMTPIDRMPWKTRYADQERLTEPNWSCHNQKDNSPGDVAYSVSGKKLNLQRMRGWYFDPRLGCRVKE